MVEYTFAEYTDMILPYGEARRNGRAARRPYQDCFPQRLTPSHTLFAVITQRLRERGTFTASRNDCGAPRRLRTPELEEAVGTTVHVLDLNVNHHLKRPKQFLMVTVNKSVCEK